MRQRAIDIIRPAENHSIYWTGNKKYTNNVVRVNNESQVRGKIQGTPNDDLYEPFEDLSQYILTSRDYRRMYDVPDYSVVRLTRYKLGEMRVILHPHLSDKQKEYIIDLLNNLSSIASVAASRNVHVINYIKENKDKNTFYRYKMNRLFVDKRTIKI